MNLSNRDLDLFSEVDLNHLHDYLKSKGWEQVRVLPRLTAYRHPKFPDAVLRVPANRSFPDFKEAMAILLKQFCHSHKKSVPEVLVGLGIAPQRPRRHLVLRNIRDGIVFRPGSRDASIPRKKKSYAELLKENRMLKQALAEAQSATPN
jgi:hypothetical protein